MKLYQNIFLSEANHRILQLPGEKEILFTFKLGRKEDETPFVVQWFAQQGIEVWSTEEGQQKFDNHVEKENGLSDFWPQPDSPC